MRTSPDPVLPIGSCTVASIGSQGCVSFGQGQGRWLALPASEGEIAISRTGRGLRGKCSRGHGRPAGSNHRPFLAFTGIDARAERPRGRRGRIRGARFIGEYVPIRFRFRCVFLADGTKRVCIQGVREVRMEKVKASLYIIPVFLEFEGVEMLYNM